MERRQSAQSTVPGGARAVGAETRRTSRRYLLAGRWRRGRPAGAATFSREVGGAARGLSSQLPPVRRPTWLPPRRPCSECSLSIWTAVNMRCSGVILCSVLLLGLLAAANGELHQLLGWRLSCGKWGELPTATELG